MDQVPCSLCRTEFKGNLRHPGLSLFITSVIFLMGVTAFFILFFHSWEGPIFIFTSCSSHTVLFDSIRVVFLRKCSTFSCPLLS